MHHRDDLEVVNTLPIHDIERKPAEKKTPGVFFEGRPSLRRFDDLDQGVVEFLRESGAQADCSLFIELPCGSGLCDRFWVEADGGACSLARDDLASLKPIDCLDRSIVKLLQAARDLSSPLDIDITIEGFIQALDEGRRETGSIAVG